MLDGAVWAARALVAGGRHGSPGLVMGDGVLAVAGVRPG